MKKICPCGAKSVPGLLRSIALCQKHYNGLMFAAAESAEHKDAVAMLNRQKR